MSETGRTLVVADKRLVAAGVAAIELRDPDGARLPDWTPGSHIDLVLPDGVVRQYSLCGDRRDAHVYRIAVLREVAGRGGSAQVHDRLVVSDRVGLGGPRNAFRLAPAARYLFVAGGIGITPILPMIDAAERLGAQWQLLYGGRSRASMAFLDDLSRYGDRVVVHPVDEAGLLPLDAHLGEPAPDRKVHVCGPGPLLDAVHARCAGWPAGSLRTERFVAAEVDATNDRAFDVELASSGRTVPVGPGIPVVDALRAAGVSVLTSCRRGLCGTCEVDVLDGVPDHRDSLLDDEERRSGRSMFVCVSRSRTPRLVLDL
ncbi:PDR/VanB family oxidoreductase [Agilicoccus flavus]|uniref:PDR/VanB family oxidoreductase n=1 Tax=Agilicoccus flavus TaxID=2775968 RepID=UPI001CF6C822|nr:PDR/VanB family oxidoreductase [Agilicoccus flavus]